MQRIDGRLVFSPSDLNHFLECEHLIQLQRRADARELARPCDAQADLLASIRSETSLSSTSIAPSYSVRFRMS